MASTFPPTKDQAFLAFTTNLSARITAAPTPLGLSSADATSLASLLTTYSNCLTTANTPSTRTKSAVGAKNVAKAQLLADVRVLAKRIQANPAVTVPMRQDLGLPIHQTIPTPVPAPSTAPILNLLALGEQTHTIRIADQLTPDKSAKPPGVEGAQVYYFLSATAGTLPPGDLLEWTFAGIATRSDFTITYPTEAAGKTAFIRARWQNPRAEPGPVSPYVSGVILGIASGSSLAA